MENIELIKKIKKKKEFSQLPNSIVRRLAEICDYDVKKTRALLRKYFGVFLTNKVLKGKNPEVLTRHISSKKRDYQIFYKSIFKKLPQYKFKSIIDLGSGVNGFSYNLLSKYFPNIDYIALEASGKIVENMNYYFIDEKYKNSKAIQTDLFNLKDLEKVVKDYKSPRLVFIFQLIDALETFQKNFSKKLFIKLKENTSTEDIFVITLPLESLSGKTKFNVQRKWLMDFLNENFILIEDFNLFGERIIIFKNTF